MSNSKSSIILHRDFGRWLRRQRELHGVSQKFVAAKSKITVTQLSRIENGHSGTRRDTVILLARIIGIDETEALRQFAPEGFARLPEELENIPFYEFDKQDLKEIAAFINFKLTQKRAVPKSASSQSELSRTEVSPEGLSKIPPYRVTGGRLISDAEKEKKAYTEKKPPE